MVYAYIIERTIQTYGLSSGYHGNIVITGLCVVLACGLGNWCNQLKQERDMYKAGYEKLYQEIKRIEDATEVDEKSLENAENSLKNVLLGFERQSNETMWISV